MSANQSNLSNPHYGYDFVVATTQESINATMKDYLYFTTFPTVKMYWNQDAAGNPVAVSYDDLMKQTNGTDPLTVPSWNTGDPTTPEITDINNSNFYFAFEAAIGIPAAYDIPSEIPDIITLQENSQTVLFNLLCANFTVVTCNFGRHGLTSFLNASQPADAAWTFTSSVALKNIIADHNLPPAVQKQLDNFGPDAFSVQQLIFDLDNAALESVPTISGIESGTPAYTLLSQVFPGTYFKAMQTSAQPVLNYGIVKNSPAPESSTLILTDMEFEVSPYLDPADNSAGNPALNTLNYLCATVGKSLPPVVPFDWNWVEKSDESSCDGVISINRNTFADYFEAQLTPYVSGNCFLPYVHVSGDIHYAYSLTGGQTPTIKRLPAGAEVLSYSYEQSASGKAGLGGDMGAMTLKSTFNLSVEFSDDTIVITQNLLVYMDIRRYQSSISWNPIDKTYIDTYTLSIDDNGGLTVKFDSTTEGGTNPPPPANWFIEAFTKLDHFTADIDSWLEKFTQTNFQDMPVNFAQQFIFPGGKTFDFKNIVFSANQDLVSDITYVPTRQN